VRYAQLFFTRTMPPLPVFAAATTVRLLRVEAAIKF
jgi:hypothetical protein